MPLTPPSQKEKAWSLRQHQGGPRRTLQGQGRGRGRDREGQTLPPQGPQQWEGKAYQSDWSAPQSLETHPAARGVTPWKDRGEHPPQGRSFGRRSRPAFAHVLQKIKRAVLAGHRAGKAPQRCVPLKSQCCHEGPTQTRQGRRGSADEDPQGARSWPEDPGWDSPGPLRTEASGAPECRAVRGAEFTGAEPQKQSVSEVPSPTWVSEGLEDPHAPWKLAAGLKAGAPQPRPCSGGAGGFLDLPGVGGTPESAWGQWEPGGGAGGEGKEIRRGTGEEKRRKKGESPAESPGRWPHTQE